MNQNWKIIIVMIITAIVFGGGVYIWQSQKNVDINKFAKVVKYNCEQSGGVFENNNCKCKPGVSLDMYNEESGYCGNDEGMIDGERGQEMIEALNCRQELKKYKNNLGQ